MREQYLWAEKYRPHKVEDIILPENILTIFKSIVKNEEVPNLLLYGPPGSGKTTLARATLDELECDYIFIPASLRGNIDTLRNEIAQFASSVSFTGKRKYIILDEFDYVSHLFQPALRNFMEEFSSNAGFILTCNFLNRIIPAIQSRCSSIDFNFPKEEINKLAAKFFKKLLEILDNENVKYDKKVIASYIQTCLQQRSLDFRKILNELQKYSVNGQINSSILSNKIETFNDLISFMKNKDFTKVRYWVATETSNDTQTLIREFYDAASQYFTPQFIPLLVEILNDSQYVSTMVVDQEICLTAMFAKIMAEAEWR